MGSRLLKNPKIHGISYTMNLFSLDWKGIFKLFLPNVKDISWKFYNRPPFPNRAANIKMYYGKIYEPEINYRLSLISYRLYPCFWKKGGTRSADHKLSTHRSSCCIFVSSPKTLKEKDYSLLSNLPNYFLTYKYNKMH